MSLHNESLKTARGIAMALGISLRDVHRATLNETLPCIRMPGAVTRYFESECRAVVGPGGP